MSAERPWEDHSPEEWKRYGASQAELVKLGAREARERGEFSKRLFVHPASAELVTPEVEPEAVTLNLASLNIEEIREEYEAKQADFDSTPFDAEGAMLRLYAAGVTIWSGFPGSGKTTLLRQLVCHLLKAGRSIFFASLEEHPRDLLWRLVCTASGTATPTKHQAQWFLDAYGDRLRIWSVIGASKHRDLLSAIRKLGSRHAIIDSLMCLDVNSQDWEAQRQFATKLVNAARLSGCHIHLVAHPRKLISSDQPPDLNDVAGSADLGRLADNVVFVRRGGDDSPASAVTGMLIALRKQRGGTGACGVISGYFHREYRQYSGQQFPSGPTHYLPDDAYVEQP